MLAFLATNEIIWNLFSAALIGAVAGGIVAGLSIWRMRKKLAKDQQSHDQQRDKLLKEFEQDCNKRQSAWILFQELEAFAGFLKTINHELMPECEGIVAEREDR